MTPTPSHVATDELIETLERLEKEATPGPWKLFHDDDAPAVDYIERDMGDDRRAQGLEDPILHACLPREGDLPLIVSLRNHLPALISAIKENKRMREGWSDAMKQAALHIAGASVAVNHLPELKTPNDLAAYLTKRDLALAGEIAALQPQGDAKP